MMSSQIHPCAPSTASGDDDGKRSLPIKPILGGDGIPFFSAIRDRLDYFYFQGLEAFFRTRIAKYGSTVFRTNMPPGPFISSDPSVVCVLDAKSFPVLFDCSKVEKMDVFTGTFRPSLSLTGGFRVCSYLDPTEQRHAQIKHLLLNLLASRKSSFLPEFSSIYSKLFDTMEAQLESSSKSSDFGKLNDESAFEFIGASFFGLRPSDTPLGAGGHLKAVKWLAVQLSPLFALHLLPSIIEDFLLHTFRLPSFLVRSDYRALFEYVSSAAAPLLDNPVKLGGLSREDACHNLLFAAFFNAYAGFKVFFPALLQRVAEAGPSLHSELAREIRSVVEADGGLVTLSALEKMELTKSVVYETLRIDPPVAFQYGRAKKDMMIESHDAAFMVKKGEMIFGYQPLATRDERVFEKGGEFVADRFVGMKGKEMLRYVWWSNGPETESPTVGNKQCAGKEMVVLTARLLLVKFFLRYDTINVVKRKSAVGEQIVVTSVTMAAAAGEK